MICQRTLVLLALVLPAVVLTVSCTETRGRWENQDRPREEWTKDEATCRRAASDKAEREYSLDQRRTPRGYSRTRAYSASMSRFEAEKREKSLFESCMTRNGYIRTEKKPESD